MLFNSYSFIFFYLPIVLSGYFFFIKRGSLRTALSWLLIASLFFYGYWDYRFLALLLGSIFFNFAMGWLIHNAEEIWKRRSLLLAAVGVDLALLFYYKYFSFFNETLRLLTGHTFSFEAAMLPLGISFFTFTQLAYLVDLYQGKANASDFLSYSLFVTVFPHLIAGPILHHKEMIAQFNAVGDVRRASDNFAKGIFLFVVGLAKKVLIADYLATLASPVFDGPLEPLPFFHAWSIAITYTLQLYFDFSGYSDMAVGLGLLFNLHLPINFNSPYKADSMIDFWRRWHISLSIFLKDYLYIPLGGNRNGEIAKMRNLFLTMLLGGIWHGAGWTFILWGVCHGLFLVVNHLWRLSHISLPHLVYRGITLFAIILSWVLFRSPTVEMAFHIFKGMAGGYGVVLPVSFASSFSFLMGFGVEFIHLEQLLFKGKDIVLLIFLWTAVMFLPNSNEWKERFHLTRFSAPACALVFVCVLLNLKEVSEFIYYQF